MFFNSFNFIVFLAGLVLSFYLFPKTIRPYLLLLGSLFAYSLFGWKNFVLLLGVSIFNYLTGKSIEKAKSKKMLLTVSILGNLLLLFFFKYFNFFSGSTNDVFKFLQIDISLPLLDIILPIGISYYVFQAIGYNLDIASEKAAAEKNYIHLASYFFFFPKIMQGPVDRPRNLLPQLKQGSEFNYENFVDGLRRILWGFFLKLVIADRLFVLVDNVWKNIDAFGGLSVAISVSLFTLQLYFDFLGYTEIALGSAQLFGIKLMENFDKPLSSKNITEFWRRWHISLSTWLNEYLYNPMAIGWRDMGKYSMHLAVFITFFIAGIWHGAGITFMIFGSLHGIALVYEIFTKKSRKKWAKKLPKGLYDFLSLKLTFIYVSFTLIFLKSNTLERAFVVIKSIGQGWKNDITGIFNGNISKVLFLNGGSSNIAILVVLLLLFFMIETYFKEKSYKVLNQKNTFVRWTIYFGILAIIAFFGQFHSDAEFIYVNF
ncbi:MAG: MBOAT family protein [Bacteroidetes bacterium]|nr:MBOAT family protein [Bacteroidota bacterium]